MGCLLKDQRPRHQHVGRCAGIIGGVGYTFRIGLVARSLHKAAIVVVGYLKAIHPKAADGDALPRLFFGIELVGPHSVGSARNPDHVGLRRFAGRHRGVSSSCTIRKWGTLCVEGL